MLVVLTLVFFLISEKSEPYDTPTKYCLLSKHSNQYANLPGNA